METRRYGDGFTNFVGIKCGWCKVEEWHPAKNGGWAMRIFRVNGWKVGSKDNQHRCPVCFGRVLNARRTPDNPAIPKDIGKVLKKQLLEAHVKDELLGTTVLTPKGPDAMPRLRGDERPPGAKAIDGIHPVPPTPSPAPAPVPAPAYAIAVRGLRSTPGVTIHPERYNARQAATRATGSIDGIEFFTVPAPPDAPAKGWMWKLAATVTDDERIAWREGRRYGPKPTKRAPDSALGPKPTIPATPEKETTMTADVTPLRKDAMPTPAPIDTTRQPTRDERATIHDELTKVYDTVDQRYSGSDSDRVVAERLNLPRIFVTDVRAMFFGDYDRSQRTETHKKELDEAIALAKAASLQLMNMAATAETLQADLIAARKKLEG